MSQATKATPAERRGGVGGRRLADAFDAVSGLPALFEARRRLLGLCDRRRSSPSEVADAIEADSALAIVVMRAANNGSGPSGRAGGVREAVEALEVERVRSLAESMETYDVLGDPGAASDRSERFRRHAVAVRIGAERIGEVARLPQRDELAVAALVHDVGKLVLEQLYGDGPELRRARRLTRRARPPGAARVRHRPRSGRRRAGAPLGAAEDHRRRGRTPPRSGRDRSRGARSGSPT